MVERKTILKHTLVNELAKIQTLNTSDRKILRNARLKITDKLLFGEHHGSHASSCYYPSPFDEAAILTMDGVGEWVTTSIGHGRAEKIKFIKRFGFRIR